MFDIDIERFADTTTIRVVGELDVATAPLLGDALDRLAADPPPLVVVDLAQVSFLGSAGIGVLVQARTDLRGTGSRLVLAKAPDRVARVFQLLRLDAAFEFDPPLG